MTDQCHKPDEPFTYECCPKDLWGITSQMLTEKWNAFSDEKGHISCLACGRVYHVYKLGMKFTNRILCKEEIELDKTEHDLSLTFEPKSAKIEMSKLYKIICKEYKEGAFEHENYESKSAFLEACDLTMKAALQMIPLSLFKKFYVDERDKLFLDLNEAMICRRCLEKRKLTK